MTAASTLDLVSTAARRGAGIGAFNVIHIETAEALVRASEQTGLPVILQISQNCVKYHGALEPIARATLELSRAATTDVAVHLDHCEDFDLATRAVDLGFDSVMYDGSKLDYDANVESTHRVVDYAHSNGCVVEAELGEVGGKLGAHAPGVRTDPDEAKRFVESTGVDLLAVAVGSEHAMQQRTASLDQELISRLKVAAGVPLVLHGSSGVPDDEIVRAIHSGMTKINVSTHLNGYFTRAIRQFLQDNPDVTDSRKYVKVGAQALEQEAARLLRVFALLD